MIILQVLRDQGLGKYCDPDFVRAASREMQEAMDMTPEEFDQAAHRLLLAEQEGQLSLPNRQFQDEDEDQETAPLRGRRNQPLAPSRSRTKKGPNQSESNV